ncbi:phosphatase PAP2 family protein [Neptuniibacter halophilus]|uniref:phosphatase PAP2 family protein n=1 Tax=Neptuniibacter halophilus TaxID=651666 RepID=UPI00257426E5|nr:phosphatase PAP2 family protein [Neptuniibacter halophilus]
MSALKILTTFDLFAFNWCLGLPSAPQLARVSRQVSRLGDGGFYLLVGLILAVYEPQFGLLFLLTGLLAYTFELPLYLLLKNTIKRDRPCDSLPVDAYIVPSDKFSFPSGHAAAAFVFAGLVAHFYPGFTELAYSLAVMVGISRILLGVHYPTDIAAGAALGTVSTMLAIDNFPHLQALIGV